jgi:hypothetical protein
VGFLFEKLPKCIAKDLEADRKGKICLIMRSECLTVQGWYAVNPKDGRLAVTSRWLKFVKGSKLHAGAAMKVNISRCYDCNVLLPKFMLVA